MDNPQPFFEMMEQLLSLPIGYSFWKEQHLLFSLLSMLEDVGSGKADSVVTQLAERAAIHIQNHFREKISNETLAAALHFHPNYIVRCMKFKYNRTPMEYLLEFRLDRAKRLLVTNSWTIERIAEETGFRFLLIFQGASK